MTTIHLINHTHWDREWYRTFQQFRFFFIKLIDQLLEILDTDAQYSSFLLDGQTIILEDYLEIRPEREADLVRHIKNDRLFIGPWYVSSDEFLVSPESHVRNLLEGKRLCNRFGGKMAVGYLPDTFGHIGQMPQILQGFDIDSACLWRGLDDQPCELIWKAPDGSSVLLSYLRDSYSNAASLSTTDHDRFRSQIDELSNSLEPYSLSGQILLMHGTDHMEPSRGLPSAIAAYERSANQNHLTISSLPQYFSSVRSNLNTPTDQFPTVCGELRSSKHSALLPNVLSTRIQLKQRNNACETRLLRWVEPLSAWIKLIDKGYSVNNPTSISPNTISRDALIRYTWKQLMQCHPHDSICGTSIDQVANEMNVRLDHVDQISNLLTQELIQELTDSIDTRIPALLNQQVENSNFLSTIVVFNSTDFPQTGLINFESKLDAKYSSFEIIDAEGVPIPFEQKGMGSHELISMQMNKKAMKQAFGMINEGNVAGLIIREFDIVKLGSQVHIQAILTDQGRVDVNVLNRGIREMEAILTDPEVDQYIIHAYSDPQTEISFIASEVPQNGYRCYWIKGITEDSHKNNEPKTISPLLQGLLPFISRITQSPAIRKLPKLKFQKSTHIKQQIENEFFTVIAQPGANSISVYDKRTHSTFMELNKFVDGADCGDVYNYCPPEHDAVLTSRIDSIGIEKLLTNQKLIIEYDLDIPTELSDDRKSRINKKIRHHITSIISLVPGVPRIDIHSEIENYSRDHRMRVHFLAPIKTDTSYHDGHFEIVQRKIGIPEYDDTWEEPPRPEVPQRNFSSIAGENLSLTVANRGLPEVEIIDAGKSTEIAITLLRCVGWLSRDDLTTRNGHAGPMDVATPDAQMIGKYSFDYSIIPGDVDWRRSIHLANGFNMPLQTATTTLHAGILPAKCSLIENLNPDFMITSIKPPEKGSGVIVRGYNASHRPIEVSLKLMRSIKNAVMVKLDESPIEPLLISPDGTINFSAVASQIATVHLSL